MGSGGLACKDFELDVALQRLLVLLFVSVLGVATGLAGCERLCSGA